MAAYELPNGTRVHCAKEQAERCGYKPVTPARPASSKPAK